MCIVVILQIMQERVPIMITERSSKTFVKGYGGDILQLSNLMTNVSQTLNTTKKKKKEKEKNFFVMVLSQLKVKLYY